MQRRKIFVTGGTGFTGHHLSKRLLGMGHEVVILDNQPGSFMEELESMGAKVHLGSITDQVLVDSLTKGCDVVFHVAAAFRQINVPNKLYWDVNVNGTRIVAESAWNAGVSRFIYCSTCGVHGNIDNPPAAEDAPIQPADYYQYSKYEGEKVIYEMIQRGLACVTLRPAAIFGPGDPERWLMLFRRVSNRVFYMFGNGKVTYHPLYIDNLIDAFILAMEKDEALGKTYLIADANYYSLNALVNKIAQGLGIDVKVVHLPFAPLWLAAVATEAVCFPLRISPPLFRRRIDWFRQNRAFDISKARQDLGYDPRIDLSEGISQTANWYREQGYLR